MVDIEELVSNAKKHLKITNDDKFWCRTNELIALLEEGAIPIEMNQKQVKGRTYLQAYSHMVSYGGVLFFNATTELVQELERYKPKKLKTQSP